MRTRIACDEALMTQDVAYTDGRGNSFYTTYNSWGLRESEVGPATAEYSTPADSTATFAFRRRRDGSGGTPLSHSDRRRLDRVPRISLISRMVLPSRRSWRARSPASSTDSERTTRV